MITKFTPDSLVKALQYLQSGQVVSLPTETVYGLAADATNPKAIQHIFELKNRPASSPLTVHIAQAEDMLYWANSIPTLATTLAKHFWPGPLTLVLPKATHVLPTITADKSTIGLRCPHHPNTIKILQKFAKGLVISSANLSGHPSPTSAEEVAKAFGNRIPLIIDGGPCRIGIDSTIIDLTQTIPTILRVGGLSVDAIQKILGTKLKVKA